MGGGGGEGSGRRNDSRLWRLLLELSVEFKKTQLKKLGLGLLGGGLTVKLREV